MLNTSNHFFQIDWVEWNDELRQTTCDWNNTLPVSASSSCPKKDRQWLLQLVRKYMLHIFTYVPYFFHRQICLDHTPFQGLSKYPNWSFWFFRDENHVSVEAIPGGHSQPTLTGFFNGQEGLRGLIFIRNTLKGPSNHTQSMYMYKNKYLGGGFKDVLLNLSPQILGEFDQHMVSNWFFKPRLHPNVPWLPPSLKPPMRSRFSSVPTRASVDATSMVRLWCVSDTWENDFFHLRWSLFLVTSANFRGIHVCGIYIYISIIYIPTFTMKNQPCHVPRWSILWNLYLQLGLNLWYM